MSDETQPVEAAPVEAPPAVLPEVAALKGKLAQVQAKNAAETAAREDLAAKLQAFEGVDPETLADMQAAYAASQTHEQKAEADRKRLEADIAKRNADFESKQTEWTQKTQAERSRLDLAVMRDVLDSGVEEMKLRLLPGARESLLLHAKQMFKVDDDMSSLTTKETTLEPVTVPGWLAEVIKSHPYLFEGGGGGGARAGMPGGVKKQYVRDQMTPAERSRAIDEIKAGSAEWA